MKTLDFFVEGTNKAYDIIDTIINTFPCFVERKNIEMNWLEVTIKARQEDVAKIENLIAEII